MAKSNIDFAFILGAGFSRNAGMPIQKEFTEALLGGRGDGGGLSGSVVRFLRKFVAKAFGHLDRAKAGYWPELEDLFTCVDLSANTGHNLGSFDAAYLRTVRRALIYRIFTMLRERYDNAQKKEDADWKRLNNFFEKIPWEHSAFISTNWDTVIEERLEDVRQVTNFSYGCGARPADLRPPGLQKHNCKSAQARVVKLHGSINWLYCDSCRNVFWFPAKQSNKVAAQLLKKKDWEIIEEDRGQAHQKREPYLCMRCASDALGTRLATFSFEKALQFPMFQKSWFSAERFLRKAKTWVFIGYSLPAADFEFKFLLKRVQLSRRVEPRFILISKGECSPSTYDHYQHFFGRGFKKGENFFKDGLSAEAIAYILES